jgi:hypothetical protein
MNLFKKNYIKKWNYLNLILLIDLNFKIDKIIFIIY